MSCLRRYAMAVAVTVSMIACFPLAAWAESVPNEITVYKVQVVSDYVLSRDHGYTRYVTDEGKPVYSVDLTTDPSEYGQQLQLLAEADCGLQYLLTATQKGGAHSTGSTLIDFYITQAATWWYYDNENFSDEFKNENNDDDAYGLVPYYIKPAVEDAWEYAEKNAEVSIGEWQNRVGLNLPTDLCEAEDSGSEWYQTDAIMPFIGDGSMASAEFYTVSVQGNGDGVAILDEYGYERDVFPVGTGFVVRIEMGLLPLQREVKITVSSEVSIPTARIYRTIGGENYERMAALFDEDVTDEETVTVVANADAGRLEDYAKGAVVVAVILGLLI